MNLYFAGFGRYNAYVVAKNEETAIKILQKKLGINYLPFTAKKIEVDGYTIQCLKEGENVGVGEESGEAAKGGGRAETGNRNTGKATK